MKVFSTSSLEGNILNLGNLVGFKVINRHLKRWCHKNKVAIGYKDGYHTINLIAYSIYEYDYLKGENK